MQKIELGTITKPQGLKGEFRIKQNDGVISLLSKLHNVEINNQMYNIVSVNDRGGFLVFKTKEFTSIDDVEKLRGYKIYTFVDDDTFNAINNNNGYQIMADGKTIGRIVQVDNYGATDIYTLDNGLTLAVVPHLIINVDDNEKIVTVDAEILKGVIVWK